MAEAQLRIGPPGEAEITGDVDDRFAELDEDLDDQAAPLDPFVDERTVRRLLRSAGGALGALFGAPEVPGHWRFSDQELDELAPPLTNIINRRPQLRVLAARGDEAAVVLALGGYANRNLQASILVKEMRREREREAAMAEGPMGAAAPGPNGRPAPGPAHGGGHGPAPAGGAR